MKYIITNSPEIPMLRLGDINQTALFGVLIGTTKYVIARHDEQEGFNMIHIKDRTSIGTSRGVGRNSIKEKIMDIWGTYPETEIYQFDTYEELAIWILTK